MSSYGISVDLTGVGAAALQQLNGVFPLVSQAISAIANEGAARWKSAVMHATLWQGEKVAYVNSITWRMDGAFAAVIETSYANSGPIESGRPAIDQKKYLQTSLKTRIAQSGKNKGMKYLVIPFRHNTPGHTAHAPAMPTHVYEFASKLKPSRVIGQHLEPNVHGRLDASGKTLMVQRSKYQWGGRLHAGLAGKAHPGNATDRYAGMVKMDTTPGGAKGGGPRSSAYLTFRVMGQWSSGWVKPAKPGLFLVRGVAEQLAPLAEGALQEAMKQTVLGP